MIECVNLSSVHSPPPQESTTTHLKLSSSSFSSPSMGFSEEESFTLAISLLSCLFNWLVAVASSATPPLAEDEVEEDGPWWEGERIATSCSDWGEREKKRVAWLN